MTDNPFTVSEPHCVDLQPVLIDDLHTAVLRWYHVIHQAPRWTPSSTSIVAYCRFHIFHFFHLSRTFRGRSPLFLFLYKALPCHLAPQPFTFMLRYSFLPFFFDCLLIIPFLDSYVFCLGTHNIFSLSLSHWDSYVFRLGLQQAGPFNPKLVTLKFFHNFILLHYHTIISSLWYTQIILHIFPLLSTPS